MRTFLASLILVASTALLQAGQPSGFRDVEGEHLEYLHNGKPVLRYMYGFDDSSPERHHETYKPYHHVMAPDGQATLTKGAGGQYTHHRGIFIGFARLGHAGQRYDLWHMKNVDMVHQKFIDKSADAKGAAVTSLIHWQNSQGEPIVAEQRTVSARYDDADAYVVIDFISELTAPQGEVELSGDPEHAGMQYRPSNEVAENKSARYTFHKEGIDPKKDKDLPWVALTYKLGDQLWTVQHMRHPSDPSDSVYSAYRDYGRFGNYFVATIPEGETLKVKYRLRITQGDTPSREELARQYEKYAGK